MRKKEVERIQAFEMWIWPEKDGENKLERQNVK